MVESNYPELTANNHHEGSWQRCSICNNEFRISTQGIEKIELLGNNPYLTNQYDELDELEPLFKENDRCMECIRKICRENVKRDLITLFSERKNGIPDTEEMVHRWQDLRTRAKTLEKMGLLSHSKGLRPVSFMGLGERLFEEKLATINGSIEFLFQDFPHIEENEFFIREMEALFDATDSFVYIDPTKAELEKTDEFNLKPRIMFEKMLEADFES